MIVAIWRGQRNGALPLLRLAPIRFFSSDFHCDRDPQQEQQEEKPSLSQHKSQQQQQRRRKRYDFGNIPSFREFQHNLEVRRLYRNFMRLLKGPQHGELRHIVRTEFRTNDADANMNRKVTDGRRRFKEIQAMINAQSNGSSSSSSKLDPTTTATSMNNNNKNKLHSSSQIWPWNRSRIDDIQLPPTDKNM